MRQNHLDLTPSLFPILSVLVGLLGALIFVMATVTAFALGPGRTVRINLSAPAGADTSEEPIYLEFDGTSLVLHPSRDRVAFDSSNTKLSEEEVRQVVKSRGDPWKNYWKRVDVKFHEQFIHTPVAPLLEKRDDGQQTYVVVLVRPSGFESFLEIRNFLIRQGLDVGYEPIEQAYRVRVE